MDPFIGEIRPFPFTFAPLGWLYCDGSLQSISNYPTLFQLIGTTYGGDGQTTFGLPDLRGRVPMGAATSTQIGQLGGAETVALNSGQVPLHSHGLTVSTSGTSASPVGVHPGLAAPNATPYGAATGTLGASAISPNSGGTTAHANIQPYLAIAFCISTEGVYPTQ